jgi:predicted RNase H-like nuclease (RuvC/YqgF family)
VTDIPELPAEFESTEALERYIDRLYDRIESLREELDDEQRTVELLEELNGIDAHLATSTEERERAHDALEAVVRRMERIDLHGGPSDVGLRDNLRNPDFGGN